MKRTAVILLLICLAVPSFSQVKTGGSGLYGGLAYSLVFFTNSDVTNVYPSFDFRKNSLKSEVNPYLGYQPTKSIAFEFSPGLMYSNSNAEKGFYYSAPGTTSERYYYYPRNAFLLTLPINVKVKLFPFAQKFVSLADGIFISAAGGPMMIREEYDNEIYYDENMQSLKEFRTVNNTTWTGNFQISAGFSSQSVLAYGIEIGYRFVPLSVDKKYPLISSVAGNLNSVILSLKIGYSF